MEQPLERLLSPPCTAPPSPKPELQQQQAEESNSSGAGTSLFKKRSIRRLSFFKSSSSSLQSSTSTASSSASQQQRSKKSPHTNMTDDSPIIATDASQSPVINVNYSPVLTTNTINKEYDAETGNKIINNFMIIREIGRGMHGKVKLAEDLDTGELVAIKIVDKQARKKQLGYNMLRHQQLHSPNSHETNNSSGTTTSTTTTKKTKKSLLLRRYSSKDSKEKKRASKKELQDNLHRFHSESEQKIRREMAILKKCAHPHVVRLKEVIDDPTSRKIYLALEYMEGGEIVWRKEEQVVHDGSKPQQKKERRVSNYYDMYGDLMSYHEGDDDRVEEEEIRYLPVLTMDEARHIFRDVVCGLDYLHHQGVIHRDIKPANLLYATKEKTQVKISDFGVSYFNPQLAARTAQQQRKDLNDEIDRELAETAGTPAFFAPELCSSFEQDQENQDYHITKAIDVWALGVTLYCLIYGRCPFTAATEFELFDIIPTQPLTFPTEEEVGFQTPDTLKDLLQGLLTKSSKQRMTLEQVKHHPWVLEDLETEETRTAWWVKADPSHYQPVEVSEEDVSKAVTTLMDRLKSSFRRLSISIFGSSLSSSPSTTTGGKSIGSNKSTKSNSSSKKSGGGGGSGSTTTGRHAKKPSLTSLSAITTTSSIGSSASSSCYSFASPSKERTTTSQKLKPITSYNQESTRAAALTDEDHDEGHDAFDMDDIPSSSSIPSQQQHQPDSNLMPQRPFSIVRNDSSSSSMSGLIVTFGGGNRLNNNNGNN